MKKKIIALALAAIIAVTAIASASLAYLMDTDSADNTFVVGNVQIELVEQQRGENGLENFVDNKVLLPIVGSAQGKKDSLGMPTAANYVDKIVTVKNTGASAAYIRVIVAVPAELEEANGSNGPLHWNLGNKFNGATTEAYNTEVVWKYETKATIGAVEYNLYSFTYQTPVNGGAVTPFAAITGFYLNSGVNNRVDANGKIIYTFNGQDINYDLTTGFTVPVFAQAIQSDGFATAAAAFEASGLPVNPWAN